MAAIVLFDSEVSSILPETIQWLPLFSLLFTPKSAHLYRDVSVAAIDHVLFFQLIGDKKQ